MTLIPFGKTHRVTPDSKHTHTHKMELPSDASLHLTMDMQKLTKQVTVHYRPFTQHLHQNVGKDHVTASGEENKSGFIHAWVAHRLAGFHHVDCEVQTNSFIQQDNAPFDLMTLKGTPEQRWYVLSHERDLCKFGITLNLVQTHKSKI